VSETWLVELDQKLFLLVNGRWHTAFLDRIMPIITDQSNWVPVLVGLWVAVMIWGGRRGRTAGVIAILALALSDLVSSHLLKPLVGRVRPCNALSPAQCRLLVGASNAFSFPSSHAANSFSMATVFSSAWPRVSWLLFAIAGVVAYSRPYVGVHYPLDSVAGALLGFACGRLMIAACGLVLRFWKRRARTAE
jgi:undecaprenyl-diphosphatase